MRQFHLWEKDFIADALVASGSRLLSRHDGESENLIVKFR